jgi:hypothetical protein
MQAATIKIRFQECSHFDTWHIDTTAYINVFHGPLGTPGPARTSHRVNDIMEEHDSCVNAGASRANNRMIVFL